MKLIKTDRMSILTWSASVIGVEVKLGTIDFYYDVKNRMCAVERFMKNPVKRGRLFTYEMFR